TSRQADKTRGGRLRKLYVSRSIPERHLYRKFRNPRYSGKREEGAMFNHYHHWTQVLTRASLCGLLLGCALMSSPQTANATEPIPSLRHATWEGALLSSHTNLTLPLP